MKEMFPIDRYKFYVNDEKNPTKVYAISTYASKTVRGTASCDPRDTFSLEKGKELAAARCAEKVAKKRVDRAHKKYNEALDQAEMACRYLDRMKSYKDDAINEFSNAVCHVNDLLNEM